MRKSLLTLALLLATTTLRAEKRAYKEDWDDLDRYPQAEWLHEMKFGMYWHWGIPSISGVAGWYGRMMYDPKSAVYKKHTETYGEPGKPGSGYKDLIPLFTADGFSAEEWVTKAKKSGAKFVVAMGVHHDGYQMSKTKYTRWNSVDMNPHIDIVGELEKEAHKQGVKFGVSSHLAFNWEFFSLSMYPNKFDASEAPDLYNIHDPKGSPSPEFAKMWYDRTKELIDNYDLDFLWFDFGTKEPEFNKVYTKRITADFYNQSVQKNKQVALAAKVGFENMKSLVFDVEHGKFAYTRDRMWMADCTMNYKWFNTRVQEDPYSITGKYWTHNLIDIVSKNGTLLLNMGPNANGSWVKEWEDELMRMGKWLDLNGEAIYNTEPWHRFGEGPTNGGDGLAHLMDDHLTQNDIRFTRKGNTLYAIVCGWRSTPIRVRSLGTNDIEGLNIKSVELIGSKAKIKWAQHDDALTLNFPASKFSEYAYVFKIEGENLFPERKEYVEIDVPLTPMKNIKEVRIVSKGRKKVVELAELYLIGSFGNGKDHNVARFGAPISSGDQAGFEAALAFDNNLNGNRNLGSIAKSAPAKDAYLGMRMDSPIQLNRVLIYPEMNSRTAVIENYTLQIIDNKGDVVLEKPLAEIASTADAAHAAFADFE